jgi:peptidoglycan/LPS O-acetylase OafA/YrhL
VDIFVIISGFVIFFLLDKQRETYQQFIVRRFFRLFPVFVALFAISIPLSQLAIWNVTHASQYLTPNEIERLTGTMGSWWENIQWHLPLHLVMLHSLVPEVLLKGAPQAFLIPAWSISLEWQFYLVAPLAYALAVSSKPLLRVGLCTVCIALVWAARHILPYVMFGAALPFHVEFFFLGALSYFAYKRYATHGLSDVSFPVACTLAVFLFVLSDHSWLLIPIELWLIFMGLLLEHSSSFSSRLVSPLFANPFVQYLGRISYSIYLSHSLVMIVVQHGLLAWAPHLSQTVHTGILLACTTAATIPISAGLYRWLEASGIQAGRAFALRLAPRQAIGPHEERVRSRRSPDQTLIQEYK